MNGESSGDKIALRRWSKVPGEMPTNAYLIVCSNQYRIGKKPMLPHFSSILMEAREQDIALFPVCWPLSLQANNQTFTGEESPGVWYRTAIMDWQSSVIPFGQNMKKKTFFHIGKVHFKRNT